MHIYLWFHATSNGKNGTAIGSNFWFHINPKDSPTSGETILFDFSNFITICAKHFLKNMRPAIFQVTDSSYNSPATFFFLHQQNI
jgi:hypothetical protein